MSTAASAFKKAGDVPPLLLAGWRLQATSVLLTPGAVYQVRAHACSEARCLPQRAFSFSARKRPEESLATALASPLRKQPRWENHTSMLVVEHAVGTRCWFPVAAPRLIMQWRQMEEAERARVLGCATRTLLAGICLGFHFGLWVAAVLTTTVPHAALFVSGERSA